MPEPPPKGAEVPKAGPPLFMVHKHDASRLHYDLRLEMAGVLASWAIPKGPSYDPDQKRLAVQTEDHPIEYGSFEGRIPDGEYGAGDSIIWDRGTYDTVPPGQAEKQREKGHLHLLLRGEKLNGAWHLVRTRRAGGKAQWLFFKAKDGLERRDYDVVAERPESVVSGRRVTYGPVTQKELRKRYPDPVELLRKVWPPMLAQLSTPQAVGSPADYLFEVKYDGYRGLAAVSGHKLAFWTRNALDLAGRFPDIARALERLVVGEAVLDGEVVAFDAGGISRFQLLHDMRFEHRFVVFDLLWLDGEDLRGRPLEERRDLLQSVLANVPPPIQPAHRLALPMDEALEAAQKKGLEGIIAKRKGSTYQSGTRSRDWLKLKVLGTAEVAILGFTPLKKGGSLLGALLVGVYENGAFRYAGKVGTGYTEKMRAELRALLEKDRVEKSAAADAPKERDAIWVRPRHAAQVTFTEWTRDGKLRHPSFQGLREDKRPEECTRERAAAPVRPVPPPVKRTGGKAVVFSRPRLTKADLFAYFQRVFEPLWAAVTGRPVLFETFARAGKTTLHRRIDEPPAWMHVFEGHPVIDRPEALWWLLEKNAFSLRGWTSRVMHVDEPDWVVFELDGPVDVAARVALALRGLLEELSLFGVPKTSGPHKLTVLVPTARGHTHRDAADFAQAVASTLAKGLPDWCTVEKGARERKVLIDVAANGRGESVLAPYSLWPGPGALVSAPLRWSEVGDSLDPAAFDVGAMARRLDEVGDLFEPARDGRQRLPRLRPEETR